MQQLRRRGARVEVATVQERDLEPYRLAVRASAQRLAQWNPVDPDDLGRHLSAQSAAHRTFIIRALHARGSHDIVGKVNVTNVVRGRFQNGTIGYDAYDPYVGQGLFREGLGLVIGLAFTREPDGMGLHRVEANVQPGNVTSAGVLRALGFQRQGHVPDMLWLTDRSGTTAWRDHDSFAVTAGEWPAKPYAPHRPPRTVVIVNGLPGAGKTTLARRLSQELGLPLLSKDVIKEAVGSQLEVADTARLAGRGSVLGGDCHEALWDLLSDAPGGAVLESWFAPSAHHLGMAGLRRAGVDPARVLQVWCEVSLDLARCRFEERAPQRAAVHGPQVGVEDMWGVLADQNRPFDLPETVRVDTSTPVSDRTVVELALRARAVS